MRSPLHEKYFPSPTEELHERNEAEQSEALLREQIEHWLNDPYTAEFVRWLTKSERGVDPKVGEHGVMLYQTGMRDGIRLIQDHMDELKRKLQRRE